MFLAQSFKKFLKDNFQEAKSGKNDKPDFYQTARDIERGCGLDPNNTATSPAFHHLIGNSWHFVLGDD